MFPAQERLAELCPLSELAGITYIVVAEEAGWIGRSGRRTSMWLDGLMG